MMNYDEMIAEIKKLNATQDIHSGVIPHGNNLIHQFEKRERGKECMYEEILALYLKTRTVPFQEKNFEDYISTIVENTNRYFDFFWPPARNPFSHQTDFISSIIPEMLCTIFGNIIRAKHANLEVSAQKDLTIEYTFDISGGGTICFKNKRVDVAVVKPCNLTFNEERTELPIPLLAIECKTNLDKNMLSGIEHSVTELKKTFPKCNYFVVTELSDFDVKKLNYASSGINEIYILRKQKRGDLRRRNKPQSRNPIDSALVYEIASSLVENINLTNTESINLVTRMHNGKLIGRV